MEGNWIQVDKKTWLLEGTDFRIIRVKRDYGMAYSTYKGETFLGDSLLLRIAKETINTEIKEGA